MEPVGRRFAAGRSALALAVFSLSACSTILGIDFPPLRPGDASDAEASAGDGALPDGGLAVPLAASCRGVKEKLPGAPSGTYALTGQDGGFYCDMETGGGGWTLVRPDMVKEGKTQDADPASTNTLDVVRTTDSHGGARWMANVTNDDCNASGRARALHWILVDELDGWEKIMATYTFTEGVGCWNLFGDTGIDSKSMPDLNVRRFDPANDVIDRQENMARTTGGAAIPYDGRTGYCGPGLENFWHNDFRGQRRTARVALRRVLQGKPGGVFVATSCGRPAWTLEEVFVR